MIAHTPSVRGLPDDGGLREARTRRSSRGGPSNLHLTRWLYCVYSVVMTTDERNIMLPVPNPDKVKKDSIKALRHAWPHRHTLRGRVIVDANVRMLRRIA